MTMPYLSQVSITLSSRMEPPGWAIYRTPLRCARSMLSPKGKNASEPDGEELFPYTLGQYIHAIVRDVHVDGVVPVGAADIRPERQSQNLRMLAEMPDVRLVPSQAGAMDAALLTSAHPDGLAVLGVADGIRLGVFQGDEG